MSDVYFNRSFFQCTKAGVQLSDKYIRFYHPDLVQTKAYIIESINHGSPITIHGPSNTMELTSSHMAAIRSVCHTSFRYIKETF
jgi:hypothetical protein